MNDEQNKKTNPETPDGSAASQATVEELKQMRADLTAQLEDIKKEMVARKVEPDEAKKADWNTFREEVIKRYGRNQKQA